MAFLAVYLLLSTVCHIVSVVGDIGTRGGVAYLVASLCWIMSSLLKDDLPWPQRQTVRRPRAAPQGTSAESGTRPEKSRSPRSRAWLFLTFFFFFFSPPSPDAYCEVDISSRTVALTGVQPLWMQLGMHFEYCLVSSQNFLALFENPFALSVLLSFNVAFSPLMFSLCSVCLLEGFLKPQCSLAPPMQRGRSGEACSCFSGMCPLHQRRLPSGNPQHFVIPSPPLSW